MLRPIRRLVRGKVDSRSTLHVSARQRLIRQRSFGTTLLTATGCSCGPLILERSAVALVLLGSVQVEDEESVCKPHPILLISQFGHHFGTTWTAHAFCFILLQKRLQLRITLLQEKDGLDERLEYSHEDTVGSMNFSHLFSVTGFTRKRCMLGE